MNLLLVDDDVPVLQDLQQKLNWHALGFERVFTAQSAFEATRLLGQLPVHIVVCDIEMPGRNGLDFLAELHMEHPELPCIVLTSYARFEYAQKAVQIGIVEYLLKPVDASAFEAAVRKAINLYEQHTQANAERRYSQYWLDEQRKDVYKRQIRYSGIHRVHFFVFFPMGCAAPCVWFITATSYHVLQKRRPPRLQRTPLSGIARLLLRHPGVQLLLLCRDDFIDAGVLQRFQKFRQYVVRVHRAGVQRVDILRFHVVQRSQFCGKFRTVKCKTIRTGFFGAAVQLQNLFPYVCRQAFPRAGNILVWKQETKIGVVWVAGFVHPVRERCVSFFGYNVVLALDAPVEQVGHLGTSVNVIQHLEGFFRLLGIARYRPVK